MKVRGVTFAYEETASGSRCTWVVVRVPVRYPRPLHRLDVGGAAAVARITEAACTGATLQATDEAQAARRLELCRLHATEEWPAFLGWGVDPTQPPAFVAKLVADIAAAPFPPTRYYATGLPALDRLLGGGVETRSVTVIAAPAGGGASTFARGIALQVQRQIPVLIVSDELTAHGIAARQAAALTGRPWRELAESPVVGCRDLVRSYAIGCDELPSVEADALAMITVAAEVIAQEHGTPPLVVVDCLSLARKRTHLRELSHHLDCAVVALESASRTSVHRLRAWRTIGDPQAYLEAVTGDVDSPATVLFLDTEREQGSHTSTGRVAVAKARSGEPGFIGVRLDLVTGQLWGTVERMPWWRRVLTWRPWR